MIQSEHSIGADTCLLEADSLPLPQAAVPSADSICEFGCRHIDAVEMFGAGSVAVEQTAAELPMCGIAADPVFQLLAVAAFSAYIILVTNYKRLTLSLAGQMFGGRLSDVFIAGRRHGTVPKPFINSAIALGLFVSTLIVVRYASEWQPERWRPSAEWLVPVTMLRVAALLAFVAAYRYCALKIIGRVSRETEFIDTLASVKKTCFAVAAVVVTPVFLLAALPSGGGTDVWGYLLAAECAVLALLFLKETFALFMGKKIPFLHWILYLCTVEAFPLTLVCASIARCK